MLDVNDKNDSGGRRGVGPVPADVSLCACGCVWRKVVKRHGTKRIIRAGPKNRNVVKDGRPGKNESVGGWVDGWW